MRHRGCSLRVHRAASSRGGCTAHDQKIVKVPRTRTPGVYALANRGCAIASEQDLVREPHYLKRTATDARLQLNDFERLSCFSMQEWNREDGCDSRSMTELRPE